METLCIYFIKSSGLIGMFYLSYYFMLRKETFFNSNRWFLVSGLITSVVLPFLVITKTIWVNPSSTSMDWPKIPTATPIENEVFVINWYLVFGIIYSVGILLFLIKFAFDFYSLSKVLKGKIIKKQADFKFVDVSENISPFSYFNYIVYNSALYSKTELENILEHEKVHSAQKHTIDVLISRLFCIVFWYNPFVWLYKKAIIQNLEYIADNEASKNISDKKAYQFTLLKITTQENCVAITNHFYQSLIKKRIVMLNKNQSNKRNSWKYAIVIPALIAFVLLFQVKIVAQEKASQKQENDKKQSSLDLTLAKNQKDLNTLSKGKEIYINGEKSSEEELTKLDPNDIKSIAVNKDTDKQILLVDTKNDFKPVKITDKDIYIDGVKATNEEFSELDPNAIDKVDVNTFENTVRITTKSFSKTINDNDIYINNEKSDKNELLQLDHNTITKMDVNKNEKTIRITTKSQSSDILNIPIPPTPPVFTFKTPKPPVFPKAPKAPNGDPINGDKKAWKAYENKMEAFNKKMDAMEPQMKAFEKQMEEFEKQMEPFNTAMEAFEKKMKIYELQMEKYETKMKAEIRK